MTRMPRKRRTQKQETFCLKYFELGNASEAARLAGYSAHTAHVIGRENLTKPLIQERLSELRKTAEDASVATVLERKQVLTGIIRGRFSDFENIEDLKAEDLKSAALQEVKITDFQGGPEGRAKQRTVTIKLRDPIAAIAEINRMEKVYEMAININQDNRTVNIIVENPETRDMLTKIGDRLMERSKDDQ